MSEQEFIESPAVKYHVNGELYRGDEHANIVFNLIVNGYDQMEQMEKGFVTNTGRFVDRKEAFQIAEANDQIKENSQITPGSLHSQNLK